MREIIIPAMGENAFKTKDQYDVSGKLVREDYGLIGSIPGVDRDDVSILFRSLGMAPHYDRPQNGLIVNGGPEFCALSNRHELRPGVVLSKLTNPGWLADEKLVFLYGVNGGVFKKVQFVIHRGNLVAFEYRVDHDPRKSNHLWLVGIVPPTTYHP